MEQPARTTRAARHGETRMFIHGDERARLRPDRRLANFLRNKGYSVASRIVAQERHVEVWRGELYICKVQCTETDATCTFIVWTDDKCQAFRSNIARLRWNLVRVHYYIHLHTPLVAHLRGWFGEPPPKPAQPKPRMLLPATFTSPRV
jgi:hypothetical protein